MGSTTLQRLLFGFSNTPRDVGLKGLHVLISLTAERASALVAGSFSPGRT